MKIYVLEGEYGDYDDRTHFVVWVGTDEEKAFRKADTLTNKRNFISIWENGQEVSQYMRDCWHDPDKEGPQYSTWERNSGAILPRLEKDYKP